MIRWTRLSVAVTCFSLLGVLDVPASGQSVPPAVREQATADPPVADIQRPATMLAGPGDKVAATVRDTQEAAPTGSAA